MTSHYLWPTLILEEQYESPEEFKSIFWNEVMQYIVNGQTGEHVNAIDMHLNPAFENLYTGISNSLRNYFAELGMHAKAFDINITKSWMNIKGESPTRKHRHSDAHYSFVYYVNVPEHFADHDIIFHAPDGLGNEGFHGMFSCATENYNFLNTPIHYFSPVEGKIVIFPGHVAHEVKGDPECFKQPYFDSVETLKGLRIAIAGDVHLTYSAKAPRHAGIQPVSNWKSF